MAKLHIRKEDGVWRLYCSKKSSTFLMQSHLLGPVIRRVGVWTRLIHSQATLVKVPLDLNVRS